MPTRKVGEFSGANQRDLKSVGNFTDREFFLRKSRNNSFFHILGGGFNFF